MQNLYLRKRTMVGYSKKTNFINELSTDTSVIPQLLNNFEIYLQAEEKNDLKKYIIYSEFDVPHPVNYTISVASSVLGVKKCGEIKLIDIYEGDYLKFPVKDNSREIINNKWLEIIMFFSDNNKYQRAYRSDYEEHKINGEVNIFVSIL